MKAVWIADPEVAFTKAQLLDNGKVQLSDGSVVDLPKDEIFQVNPAQFDKANDIAELTFLNEASVVNNLSTRYQSHKIYTYSGLFLVAVNPYEQIDIYGPETMKEFSSKTRDECDPHIYAIAEAAFRQMLETRANQSILITGESGAGKTENTKRTIQYLSAITSKKSQTEEKILQTNPVLEAFGNAQTVRNNNSSRFGKFIRIEFAKSNIISGASIDWYLLEKSRVIVQSIHERNYHIFYYLLSGAKKELRQNLGLTSQDPKEYRYLSAGATKIDGVDDSAEYTRLLAALKTVGFSQSEIDSVIQIVAAVLLLGNIEVTSMTTDQGRIPNMEQVRRVCKLLGVKEDKFAEILVKPKIKAGREVVSKANSADQIRHSINALSMALYERLFGHIVDRLNSMLHSKNGPASSSFIGVLDIAGFEIFENNSFEQLCINYTNEKLQQFFNHHMFVLEQAEYVKEEIEWEYVDYGSDLQPTIDLIEKQSPMGIFACLDEECVMPRATDRSFTDKLSTNWSEKSNKFKPSRLHQGFIVSHYAGQVEYSTDGWLEKNKDPFNDQITDLLSQGSNSLITTIFAQQVADTPSATSSPKKVRKGMFRTVAQRHKEQLNGLMNQLSATHPHFVRCIVPNQQKNPGVFDNKLVLDQLRCNGVLEGIRIARSGFPNRVEFKEFKERYQALIQTPRQFADSKSACEAVLKSLQLNPANYKIGTTKVFFKNGVLAELEEIREKLINTQTLQVQAIARGFLVRRYLQQQAFRNHAGKTLALTARTFLKYRQDGWWKTYQNIRPLLASTESQQNNRKDLRIQRLEQNLEKSRSDYAILETRQDELSKGLETLEGSRKALEDKVSEKQELVSKILSELKEAENKLQEQTAAAVEELDATKSSHGNTIEKLKYDLKNQMEKAESSTSKFELLEKSHESLKSQLATTLKTHESLKTSHDDLRTQHKELQDNHDRLQASHNEASKNARASKSHVDVLKSQVAQLEVEIKQLKNAANGATKDIAAKNDHIAQLKEELAGSKSNISKLESQVSTLKSSAESSNALSVENESLKKDLESSKLQFSQRLKEYVGKLEIADEEIKKLKGRTRDAQVASASLEKTTNELTSLRGILSIAKVDPKNLASELKNAASFNKLYSEFVNVKRIIGAHGLSVDGLSSYLDGVKDANTRAERAESNAQSLISNVQEQETKLAHLKIIEEHLSKSEALNKVHTRQIDALKKSLEQANSRAIEAQSKVNSATVERNMNSNARVSELEAKLSESNDRNKQLETDLSRFKQKFMEMEQAHGSLSDINRKLEKIQQEKADMLATNTKLMFGMEQQRRSSRELAEGAVVKNAGNAELDSKPQSADNSKSLESQVKILQLRLLKSERARKVAMSNALGNNGDELMKERDDAIRALSTLKRQIQGESNISTLTDDNQTIDLPKRRPLRTISNHHQSVTNSPSGKRSSSLEKNEAILQLRNTLKEETETLEMYRQRANNYQLKTQQAEVIMKNLQQSEKSLVSEIEALKAQQQSESSSNMKEISLKNETISRLRGELSKLKEDYQQRTLMDSNSTRAEAQKRISDLVEALNEVTGERDSLLASKLKLEKRAHYMWTESDPLETRKKELEAELSDTRRDLSSTRHELDEIRAKAELDVTRTQSYENRLAVSTIKNRELSEEVDELHNQAMQKDLEVKRLLREIDALNEKNIRLEKFKSRSEQGDRRVFI